MKSARPSRPLPVPSARPIAQPLRRPSRTPARPTRAGTVAEAAGRNSRPPSRGRARTAWSGLFRVLGDLCIGASVAALGRTDWLVGDPGLLLGVRARSLVGALV